MTNMTTDNSTKNTSADQVDSPETIPIDKVRISRLNPRCDFNGDVTSLVKNLKDGQLHPIILRATSDGSYEVVCGSRRFRALRELRGQTGCLNNTEFKLVDWDDRQCLKAAFSENEERESVPPLVAGQHLNRVAEMLEADGEKVTDAVLAERSGLDRQMVNDLRGLSNKAGVLPTSWREALNKPPVCRSGDKPPISITHFKVIRGLIKDGISDEVRALMDKAAQQGWSVKVLTDSVKRALKSKDSDTDGNTVGGNGSPANGDTSPAKPVDPITVGQRAVKAIRELADKLLPLNPYSDIPAQLNAIAEEVAKRMTELEKAKESDDQKSKKPKRGSQQAA